MAAKRQKEAYVTMSIENVQLVPKEAVLGACKTEAGGGVGTTGHCVMAQPQCYTEVTS